MDAEFIFSLSRLKPVTSPLSHFPHGPRFEGKQKRKFQESWDHSFPFRGDGSRVGLIVPGMSVINTLPMPVPKVRSTGQTQESFSFLFSKPCFLPHLHPGLRRDKTYGFI